MMRVSNKIIFFSIIFLSLGITACTPDEEVWTGTNVNPIQVVCGKSCQTITFNNASDQLNRIERNKIKRFVYRDEEHERVFVSPCATNAKNNTALNDQRIDAVKRQITQLGFTPVRLKSTLPADLKTKNCVNLLRGKLHLYVQNCPNKTIEPSVESIGTNFGCTTSYNFAQMVDNPWNLLAIAGDNGTEGDRVALGEKNYREGKHSKLNSESSS